MIEKIYNLLEKEFTIDKVKNDLLNYFEINNFDDFEIIIISTHEISGVEKEFLFKSTDKIIIESISTLKKYLNQLYLPYQINVIFGDYEESFGVAVYEKCSFEMFYDNELTLVTVDIIHILD